MSPASRVAELHARRHILRLLVARDLKVKYADTVLGYVWSLLEPLLMAGIYWVVFTKIFSRSVGEEPYIVFLISGVFPWYWANGVLSQGVNTLTKDAKLIRSTDLPREIWVMRTVLSLGVEFMLTWPVIIAFAVIYHSQVHVNLKFLAFLPVTLLMQAVLLIGVCMILAPTSVLVPDLDRVMRAVTRFLFYASPVIYSVRDVPQSVRDLYLLNPLAGILELYRAVFFADQFAGWRTVGTSAVICFLVFVAGYLVFTRLESRVLKEI